MANMTLSFVLETIQPRSLAVLVSVLFCLAPMMADGQSTTGIDSTAGGSTQKSVLVQADDENPAIKSGANGTASINYSPVQSTFTRQKFSDAPEPPSSLLVPESPRKSTFDRPSVNELLGEEVPTNNYQTQTRQGYQNDGSAAIGTLATTNQKWQDQELPTGKRATPSSASAFQRPPQVKFNGGSSRIRSAPSIVTRSQPASLPPVISTNQRTNPSIGGSFSSPAVSDKPSSWRNPTPNSNQNSTVQSYNTNSDAIGQAARSNMMQPVQSSRSQAPLVSPNRFSSNNNVQRSFNAQPIERLAGQNNNSNRDNLVRPTGFTQPITQPRPKKRSTDLAKALIARYSVDNATTALPGQPVKILEMLRQPISHQQRRPMVNQYWLTYYDWANFVSDQQYENWLRQIPAMSSVADKAMIEAASAAARNQTLSAEIQLGKSQSQLMQYMPNRQSNLLPLPNDLPLIQNYRTSYEQYKSSQMLPSRLLGIDQMLPKTLALIKKRAEAVQIAKSAADAVVAALQARQATVVTVLEAGNLWRSAEQDLIASVVDYNQAIGDYTLTVPHGYQAPEQITAMLIAKPKTENLATQSQQNFRNQPTQQPAQVKFGAGRQSQAELRRQIANQQQNSVQRSAPIFGNGSPSAGSPPKDRTALANPSRFQNQAQSDFNGGQQRPSQPFGRPGASQNQGQRTQGQESSFNLRPNQFGSGVQGTTNPTNAPNQDVAPRTPIHFGSQPTNDSFGGSGR